MSKKLQDIISEAQKIVIIQADNPDADSLASSLALEQILGNMGKEIYLYCGTSIPGYLRYLEGWDRVVDQLPTNFDASIIVDTTALALLEQLSNSQSIGWLKTKPCLIIDHHTETDPTIDFATVTYLKPAVATGEVVYELSNELSWQRNDVANNMLATSILSDSLGLTSEGTSARSINIISELVKAGVSIPKLENMRRAMQKKSPELLKYKGQLLQRIEYSEDNSVAIVTIPWLEIEKYSQEYNPSVLVLDEMRLVENVAVAIAFKTYPDGRITAKLRANYGFPIAAEIAKNFNGGGHPYAAGFKIMNGARLDEVKSKCIGLAVQLLDKLKQDNNETVQHTYSIE